MAEYHVGCGLFDIYAGTLKNEGKNGVNEWRSKSEVTNEALNAVATYLLFSEKFCGNKMDGYPDYTISFKRDKKKIYGIYHEICTLHCNRCTCTIRQAGATKEEAEQHAYNIWNKRADGADMRGTE